MRTLAYALIFSGYSYSIWISARAGAVFDAPIMVYPLAALIWSGISTAYLWAATKALTQKTNALERLSIGGLTVLFVFGGLRFAYDLSSDAGDQLVDLYGAVLLLIGSFLVTYDIVSRDPPKWIKRIALNLGSFPGLSLRTPPASLFDLSPGLVVILLISCFVLFGW